ncbi:phosphoadenosine phosphosulfate reductase family protein [Paenibacillus paeoniae]|uniref:Phosphoadenosine phosphosulfate reductase n=1 Tax=Paenibacillus paeoniae TaxID=2292705 RepID=A0A371P065_9BACL|nr:phosphoadenosine phosphosulfate reductase family protein [Paenibacillus paeoniae]REK69313.1 phosphoadenosine phosphosulfate reductase [Paenibacillus paeoniae]
MERIQQLIDQGAIFFCSHSGGKDSQAMYAYLRTLVPDHQIVVVHADLGDVEWQGVQEHILTTTEHEVFTVRANKEFLEMVDARGMWPSAKHRQCTSDLKRGPIMKFIRHYLKDRGLRIGVNCMGIRAAESTARAKKEPFRFNASESCGHRDVWDWMPIFDWTTQQVFQYIKDAGQEPFWAYADGNERLSCVFCIMGSVNDLRHGARCNPDLYRRYVDLERKIGHTMFTKGRDPITLEERTGIYI